MLLLGNFLLIATLCLLGYSLTASVIFLRTKRNEWETSAVRAIYASTALLVVASIILIAALALRDYSLEYVARHVSSTLPMIYCLTAYWAGQAGSLLFWLQLLLIFTSIALVMIHRRYRDLVPYFILFTGGTSLFFNLLLLIFTNPFKPSHPVPMDGAGMNPLLQNIMMVFHPPTLFLGYVGFTIPFAFAMAALLSGRYSQDWIRIMRKWTLVSWIFLTLGIILGMQWAYVELGWGGYWGWDPVENASFIPWLAATALLHTVILQERRGMLKKWNIFLVVLTFLLCIFGTFITRSGFIESVHAFAQSNIGFYFLGFMMLILTICLSLLYKKRHDLSAKEKFISLDTSDWSLIYWALGLLLGYFLAMQIWPDCPIWIISVGLFATILVLFLKRKSLPFLAKKLGRLSSKEGAFLLAGFSFMFFLLFVFWGTIFPTMHEALTQLYAIFPTGLKSAVSRYFPGVDSFLLHKITLSATFFNKWVTPLAAVLLLCLVVCPIISWRRPSRKFVVTMAVFLVILIPIVFVARFFSPEDSWFSIILFGLTAFAFTSILLDFFTSVGIRRKLAGETFPIAAIGLFRKNKRRYGGYWVHIGVLLLMTGIIGSAYYSQTFEAEVNIGESFQAGSLTLRYKDLKIFSDPEKRTYQAILHVMKDDQIVTELTPEKHLHRTFEQPMTEVSIIFNLLRDVYVIFTPINQKGRAYFKVLIIWIWVGGLFIILGGVYAMLPNRRNTVIREVGKVKNRMNEERKI